MTLEQMIEALKKSPKIKTSQLAAAFGVDNHKVACLLRMAQKRKLAHVAEWEYNPKGKPLARWSYGEAENAGRSFAACSTRIKQGNYTLRPRVDPMIWVTAGRQKPESL